MLFKFVYSVIIVGCSSLLGFIFANTYVERSKLLNSLLSALQMLETEIVYGATPVPTIMRRVGNKTKKEIGNIFLSAAGLLNLNSGQTFDEIWHDAVIREAKHTCLSREDIDLLLSLGKNLGISDCEDQVKHIRLIQEEFKRHYEHSLIEQNKNTKLFRNLGFLLGMAIVIIVL
ncbi:MAG: stage III sporulation protein SpoIIIAB [Candidatus Alkaliphilus sp. MAG34]|nr:stage III sporulation protein AB [Clostridiales bacterium]